MKVLHVYRTCYPETKGGIEQVIRYICKGIKNLGGESKILSLSDESDKIYEIEGTELILCKKSWEVSSNSFSPKLFKKFQELSQWADIIHYHYPWPTADLLSLTCNKKVSLATYHSDIIKQKLLKKIYQPLEMYFLKNLDAIVATSPQYRDTSQNLQKHKNKTYVIPLAIDPSDYREENLEQDSKWKLAVGTNFFLFIGVLRYYKGLHFLLDAAKTTKVSIVIAGDGPLMEELKNRIKQEKITNIILTGYISDKDKISLLSLCKAFIFPSYLRSEAFGVSLLEAQMMSKPIISCDIGTGSNYVNINNQTGLVVKPACPISLAKAIMALSENPELCKKLGKAGYGRVMQLFTVEQQAKQYMKLYQNLIAKS